MTHYTFNNFLNDAQADFSTGLICSRGNGLCFTIQEETEWERSKNGGVILPFGGIGGKLEPGETPIQALYRECLEEVGAKVEIILPRKTFLMNANGIQAITLDASPNEPHPAIILCLEKTQANRKPRTYVMIYIGRFVENISPCENPALIEVPENLLIQLTSSPLTIRQAKAEGARITSRICLPQEGVLKPIGTAAAIGRCAKDNIHFSYT